MEIEDEIRVIAYNIWKKEGCCDGRDTEYWLRAEVIWQERQKKAPARSLAKVSPRKRVMKKATEKRLAKKC